MHQQGEIEALSLSLVVAAESRHVQLDVAPLRLSHVTLYTLQPVLKGKNTLLVEEMVNH